MTTAAGSRPTSRTVASRVVINSAAPTLDDHAEASKHDQMAGEKYDEDHPGDWNHQINRATFRHQAGKKPDPTPDHGGKGYQFDPTACSP